LSQGFNNNNPNWFGSGLKTIKPKQQSNNYIVSTGSSGYQLINQAVQQTYFIPANSSTGVFGQIYGGTTTNPVKTRKKPTRTDLLVWSQNRNYQSKKIYAARKLAGYLYNGKITPGTGLNANKNIHESYELYTKEEQAIVQKIYKDLDDLVAKFRERTKELKAQEFKI
jgi:hypothetical protein